MSSSSERGLPAVANANACATWRRPAPCHKATLLLLLLALLPVLVARLACARTEPELRPSRAPPRNPRDHPAPCRLVPRRVHRRVLYVDIDIHHGDGVEEAFYTTDRVMTCSFHKFGDYFPGTGHWKDIGYGQGKRYSVNCPLRDGMDDDSFREVFRPVIATIMERYQPEAVVLQCGADSLAGDRLGCFNLSLKGHAGAVEYVRSFGLPTLVLGGGGYTMRNVARCWTYETSVLTGIAIDDELPYNDYFEYYGPDYRLQTESSNMENLNSRKYLEEVTARILESLRGIEAAPGIEVQTGSSARTPKILELAPDEDDEDESERTGRAETRRRQHKGEYYDSVRDHDVDPDGGLGEHEGAGPSSSSSAAAAAAASAESGAPGSSSSGTA